MGFVDPPLVLTARGRRFRVGGAERARPGPAPADRRGASGLDADASDSTRGDESRWRDPRAARGALRRGGAQPPAVGLLAAAGARRALPPPGRAAPRPLRRVRLRPRVPVRADPARGSTRPADQRDLVLYLPDELLIVDHRREVAQRRRYDFEVEGRATDGLPRDGGRASRTSGAPDGAPRGRPRARRVRGGRARRARGRSSAAISSRSCPGQTFFEPCPSPPSELFRRLRERNPAPYGFLINLGEAEYLVGASPEMYVRVDGDRVETCPISGTIARGRDPIADAAQILALLNSAKDESELTMCTDVDRNDKSRICVPGQRAGDRAAADRDVLAADPHGRPRRGPAAPELRRARRLPDPHLGGHRDRRAEGVGDAVHRGPRADARAPGTAARSA